MDFGDVMIIVIGIASCVISIVAKKEKDAKRAKKTTGADTYQTPVELSVPKRKDFRQELEEEGVSSIKERVAPVNKSTPELEETVFQEVEENAPKEKIDKKKLLIYSEIMKTKF